MSLAWQLSCAEGYLRGNENFSINKFTLVRDALHCSVCKIRKMESQKRSVFINKAQTHISESLYQRVETRSSKCSRFKLAREYFPPTWKQTVCMGVAARDSATRESPFHLEKTLISPTLKLPEVSENSGQERPRHRLRGITKADSKVPSQRRIDSNTITCQLESQTPRLKTERTI